MHSAGSDVEFTEEDLRSLAASGGLRDGEELKPLLEMTPAEVREVFQKQWVKSTGPSPFETETKYWSPDWKPKKRNEEDGASGNKSSEAQQSDDSNVGFDVEALFGKTDIDEVLRDLGAGDGDDDDPEMDQHAVNLILLRCCSLAYSCITI